MDLDFLAVLGFRETLRKYQHFIFKMTGMAGQF